VALARARLDRPRQVHLAICAERRALRPHRDRGVEHPVAVALRVAHVEPDATRSGAVEQLLYGFVRHRGLDKAFELRVGQQPAREERGEGKLRKHQELHALRRRLLQQRQHARERRLAAVGALRGAHLGSGKAKNSRHGFS
jgi:hypothetical protein